MRASSLARDLVYPTTERVARGDVERAENPVIDARGDYGVPHIVVGLLADLERRGRINAEEVTAGQRFHAWFELAQFETLRASDHTRTIVDGGRRVPELEYHDRARNEIDRAIRYVGGHDTLGGQCLWHVIGREISLRKWVQICSRNMHPQAAVGVLIQTLEYLSRMPWSGPGEG